MMKINIKGPSKSEIAKMLTAAAEKQISEKVRRAASPFGGVEIKFKHKTDGSLDSVEFKGSEEAVRAARDAIAS